MRSLAHDLISQAVRYAALKAYAEEALCEAREHPDAETVREALAAYTAAQAVAVKDRA